MRWFIIALAMALLVARASGLAQAKGPVPPRGYAVVEGPGLAHPIVISAPWSQRRQGYYGPEAEALINLATFAGAIRPSRWNQAGSSRILGRPTPHPDAAGIASGAITPHPPTGSPPRSRGR